MIISSTGNFWNYPHILLLHETLQTHPKKLHKMNAIATAKHGNYIEVEQLVRKGTLALFQNNRQSNV